MHTLRVTASIISLADVRSYLHLLVCTHLQVSGGLPWLDAQRTSLVRRPAKALTTLFRSARVSGLVFVTSGMAKPQNQ